MHYLFGAAGRTAVRRLSKARTVFAFDFDGTLAPLPKFSVESQMPLTTQTLLGELCARSPTVVISGRGLDDLAHRVGPLDCTLVGNHGMEIANIDAPVRQWRTRVRQWTKQLQARLSAVPEVTVETKRLSISVHWRGVSDEQTLLPKVREAVGALTHVRVIKGKKVLNLVPEGAPDKGDALVLLKRRFRAQHVLFVGDDVTDEDGFRRADDGVLGIRVGHKVASRAAFFMKRQGEMDRLLELLVGKRAR